MKNKIPYLEGLRGIAAMLVFFHHFFLVFYPLYYFGGDPATSHLGTFELSYFRSPLSVLTNGNFMVTIFFVLSGYVLSNSYFRKNDISVLTSSAIRRFPRLYIPVAVTLIAAYILLCSSLFYAGHVSFISHSDWAKEAWPTNTSLKKFLQGFLYGTMFMQKFNSYDASMWTMTYELYGSFLVLALLAITHKARLKPVIFLIVAVVAGRSFDIYYTAFIIGIGINYLNDISLNKIKYRKIIILLFVLTGLIMGGFPTWSKSYAQETFYKMNALPFLADDAPFIHIIGASLIIIALLLSPTLQKIFSHKSLLFLGDISFSLYLIHPLIQGSLGSWIFLKLYNGYNYNLPVIIALAVTLATTIVISVIMTSFIDKPGIRFSKYLYNRFFNPQKATT